VSAAGGFDRLEWMAGRDQRAAAERARQLAAPTLGQAMAAARIAVLRTHCHIRPGRSLDFDVKAWTDTFVRVPLDDELQAAYRDRLFTAYPNVDWRRDHDYHTRQRVLRSSPDVLADGGIPEKDQSFGASGDPVFANRTGAWTDPPPFTPATLTTPIGAVR
jgi:hypothetical protein